MKTKIYLNTGLLFLVLLVSVYSWGQKCNLQLPLPPGGCGTIIDLNKSNQFYKRGFLFLGGCDLRLGSNVRNSQNMVDCDVNSAGTINTGTLGGSIGCEMWLQAYRDDGIKFPGSKEVYLDVETDGFNFNASFNNFYIKFYDGNRVILDELISSKFFFDFGTNINRKILKIVPPGQWDKIEIGFTELIGVGFTLSGDFKIHNIMSEYHHSALVTFQTLGQNSTAVFEGGRALFMALPASSDPENYLLSMPEDTQYVWQVNTGAGWTDLSNGNQYGRMDDFLDITDIPRSFDGYRYRRRVFSEKYTCVDYTSPEFLLIVNPIRIETAGEISGGQELCVGDDAESFTEVQAAFGQGTIRYQWESSIDSVNFTPVSGATESAYKPSSGLTQTTYYRRAAIFTYNGGKATGYSNTVAITVEECSGKTCVISNTMIRPSLDRS